LDTDWLLGQFSDFFARLFGLFLRERCRFAIWLKLDHLRFADNRSIDNQYCRFHGFLSDARRSEMDDWNDSRDPFLFDQFSEHGKQCSGPMKPITKQVVTTALNVEGFDRWRPSVDVPHLVRPRNRPSHLPGSGRIAAVMVLLYADPTYDKSKLDTSLVLTRRQPGLRKHAGQIAFPGGRQDKGETLEETSLRETYEEIGVGPENIEVLGRLNQVYIPPTDFTVVPFIGWHNGRPEFVASESEVAEVIEARISYLLDPSTLARGVVSTDSKRRIEVPYYRVDHHRVWGATAIMLSELIDRIKMVTDPP
jgi:8-oxo-dGTP pyrophosphatase MutT (NUDIX family)